MSRRMKPQLCYQGFLFNSDSFKNGRVYWRCKESRRGSCIARALTTETELIVKQPNHNHPEDVGAAEGKKVISMDECYAYFRFNHKKSDSKDNDAPTNSLRIDAL